MSKPLALIIEDERDLSRLFTTVIQSAGFKTEQIYDGQVAMDRVIEAIPDIIILDLHLPHVSGADILKKIRTDERLSQIKVIVITADVILIEEISDDVDFFLLKPISYTQLRNLARRLYYKVGEV